MDASTASAPVVADDFRGMMSRFPTGVSIVTATDPAGAQRGMTCSSVCSVSLRPPVLLVCLRTGSPTLDAVVASGGFSVNLLHERARAAAELFASGNPRRFELVTWQADDQAAGPHLSDDAHSVADCAIMSSQEVGDHVVVYGLIQRIVQLHDTVPLLYGLRRFTSWAGATEARHAAQAGAAVADSPGPPPVSP